MGAIKTLRTTAFVFVSLLLSQLAFAQPANDDCSNAIDLGTLPTPGACIGGLQDGAAVTLTNQSTTGATGANPYSYITNCTGGGDMTAPAVDTWYTLTASGTILNIAISGFPNASIGAWTGTCGNLSPSGCINIGASGNGTLTITQTSPGDVFYIQVSGGNATATDNNFTLAADSDIDCDDCLISSTLTATPTPTTVLTCRGRWLLFVTRSQSGISRTPIGFMVFRSQWEQDGTVPLRMLFLLRVAMVSEPGPIIREVPLLRLQEQVGGLVFIMTMMETETQEITSGITARELV